MAALAVADQVDDDVLVEFLAVGERQFRHAHHSLRVVAVDVEDRRLNHAGHVCRVVRRAAVLRRGRESDLVVDDDVNGAACAVALDLRHLQGLGDHALAREGRVSVHKNRKDVENALAGELILLRADDTLEHRVYRFEMRRVCCEVHRGMRAIVGNESSFGAEVVLHIARALHGFLAVVALELAEDLRVRLAGNVGQHVEATAVRHADRHLEDVVVRGLDQEGIEERNQGLSALEGEPLLTDVLGLQEGLESLALVQLVQDAQLLSDIGLRMRLLDLVLDPGALLRVLNVHVLDADSARVGVAQNTKNLAQLHQRLATEAAGGEFTIEIPQGELVREHVEIGVSALAILERIGVGHEVTTDAIGVDDFLHAHRLIEIGLVACRDVLGPADRLVGHAQ